MAVAIVTLVPVISMVVNVRVGGKHVGQLSCALNDTADGMHFWVRGGYEDDPKIYSTAQEAAAALLDYEGYTDLDRRGLGLPNTILSLAEHLGHTG